jgi:DNA-directed RNA polymerase beta' subunit
MCGEILQEKTMHVARADAATILMPIKRGEWSYEKLMEYEETLSKELELQYQKTDLQNSPRRNKIEELGINIVCGYLGVR